MADTEVREFCSITSRTPCRVTLSTGPGPSEPARTA
jgi:hypothetical protein